MTSIVDEPRKRKRGRPKVAQPVEAKERTRRSREKLAALTPEEREKLAAKTIGSRRKIKAERATYRETGTAAALPPQPPQVLDPDLLELAEQGLPNVASGFQYVRDILTGKIDACEWVILACKRHERDMRRIGKKDWPYIFDGRRAERACKAMQIFREVKGPRANKPLILAPWQRFVVMSAYGWLTEATGARRFRVVLCFVPRGNGKTTMAAPMGLYMLSLDHEGGAEVYAAAVTRQQARLVFDVASFMAQREPVYLSRYGVTVGAHAITQDSTASTFRPLSRDASSMDGLNVHFAILDELAQHKTREVFDVLQTATGKRTQSLILAITTAGSNQSSIGHEHWLIAQRVLKQEIVDEQYFAVLYTIDPDDDWTNPAVWKKANPNWGVSVMPDVIEQLAGRAQQVASQQNAFKQKHLNVWTNTDISWMNMQAWNACADPTLNIADFKNEQCVEGLDLAAKIDLACKARLFRRMVDGLLHYYLFVDSYLPESALSDGRNDSYDTWEADGWLLISPGEVNDFNMIEASVVEDSRQFVVVDVAYDPWNAQQLAKNLDDGAIPVIEYRPTTANFSPPMKEFDALVRQKRLHHNANPVLDWCVSCVRVQEDRAGNIYPRKDRNDARQKIDGLVASLMALGRWMAIDATENAPSIG